MGMYLDIYRLVEKTACPKMEDGGVFDVGKYVLDRDYVSSGRTSKREYIFCEVPYCCCMSYWRPKNIEKDIKWLSKRSDDRKHELIRILNVMKQDKDIYFNYS